MNDGMEFITNNYCDKIINSEYNIKFYIFY